MKPFKLGLIGCSIAAKDLHWPALNKLQDKFEITVVCNRSEPKAAEFAHMVGDLPHVLDYRELLDRQVGLYRFRSPFPKAHKVLNRYSDKQGFGALITQYIFSSR